MKQAVFEENKSESDNSSSNNARKNQRKTKAQRKVAFEQRQSQRGTPHSYNEENKSQATDGNDDRKPEDLSIRNEENTRN